MYVVCVLDSTFRQVARINRILTAPARLESTSLVLASGLDLFYTRWAPSKSYDLLPPDFDYLLLSAIVASLSVGAAMLRTASERQDIASRWK